MQKLCCVLYYNGKGMTMQGIESGAPYKSEYSSLTKPTDREKEEKGKVFYGQEPPSGESTTTECGFNYQLLAVIY